jgi:lipid II:glycine glycyltransferase (peptidoglycan interpeptide bridge formation enzyme)
MTPTTRNNIRLAENQGAKVRDGREEDVEVFHRLVTATSRRRKFTPESHEYYEGLWRHLEPSRHIKLFLTEYEGEVVSGLLVIPFGKTVVAKRFGWSGSKKWLRPNELLYWKAIRWSKENGFHFFDFDGIDVAGALAIRSGASLPKSLVNDPTRFKLGFGGSIVLLPPSYEFLSSAAVRLVLQISTASIGSDKLAEMLHRTFLRS